MEVIYFNRRVYHANLFERCHDKNYAVYSKRRYRTKGRLENEDIQHRSSALPVNDGKDTVGMLTDRDIVIWGVAERLDLIKTATEDIITKNFKTPCRCWWALA
jgi:hypothetical protein